MKARIQVSSVVDPDPSQDPAWIRIQWDLWIRIRIQEDKNRKKVDKFYFLKCWMFSFEGSPLDVL